MFGVEIPQCVIEHSYIGEKDIIITYLHFTFTYIIIYTCTPLSVYLMHYALTHQACALSCLTQVG